MLRAHLGLSQRLGWGCGNLVCRVAGARWRGGKAARQRGPTPWTSPCGAG
jgi:hypothetical protein